MPNYGTLWRDATPSYTATPVSEAGISSLAPLVPGSVMWLSQLGQSACGQKGVGSKALDLGLDGRVITTDIVGVPCVFRRIREFVWSLQV